MFEQIYASTWHHPVLFWVVGAPWLVYFLLKWRECERFLPLALAVFQLATLADAWLTSPWSVMPNATVVAVIFVILGDLRFFVLLERFSFPHSLRRWTLGALALSLLVPVGSVALQSVWSGRKLFLAYELAFAVLALVIRYLVLPRRSLEPPVRRWLEGLTMFEVVQYATWALADVIILSGRDVGFLLRLFPNFMYYAAVVPFAWLTAPRELRS